MLGSAIKESTVQKEGDLRASKWLQHQFLLSAEAMAELFQKLGTLYICPSSGPIAENEAVISSDQFLLKYREYVECIQKGAPLDISVWRRFFCNYLTQDLSFLYKIVLPDHRVIIKSARPVLQMQLHTFFPSEIDGKFHSMVMTSQSIHFGLQLSYPQLFQDPKTFDFLKTNDSQLFPNTLLFKKLVGFLRASTVPTPLEFQGKVSRAVFRIGKDCFSWINSHVQLLDKHIKVVEG